MEALSQYQTSLFFRKVYLFTNPCSQFRTPNTRPLPSLDTNPQRRVTFDGGTGKRVSNRPLYPLPPPPPVLGCFLRLCRRVVCPSAKALPREQATRPPLINSPDTAMQKQGENILRTVQCVLPERISLV